MARKIRMILPVGLIVEKMVGQAVEVQQNLEPDMEQEVLTVEMEEPDLKLPEGLPTLEESDREQLPVRLENPEALSMPAEELEEQPMSETLESVEEPEAVEELELFLMPVDLAHRIPVVAVAAQESAVALDQAVPAL